MLKTVSQKHSMGCGVACIACVSGIGYSKAIKLVSSKNAFTKGYYCKDLIKALRKLGLNYDYKKITSKTKKYLKKKGVIVFIKRSAKYPNGHYLVKTEKGWMNSWINFPKKPVKAGFNERLPGKVQWILFRVI